MNNPAIIKTVVVCDSTEENLYDAQNAKEILYWENQLEWDTQISESFVPVLFPIIKSGDESSSPESVRLISIPFYKSALLRKECGKGHEGH